MGNIGSTEIIVIALVIFIFFGAKRLPEIARGLGKGIGEFKKATRDIQNELNVQADDYQYQLKHTQKSHRSQEFFCGRLFWTARNLYPNWFSFTRMVSSVGSSSSL